MKRKNNPATSNEIEATLEATFEATLEAYIQALLKQLPKSERVKWLMQVKPGENLIGEALRYAATTLLLDAKRSQAQGSPVEAKLTAQFFECSEVDAFKDMIQRAANAKNKQFFIDLGKCLSGEMNCELWDKLDFEVAWILCFMPKISAKAAVTGLKKLRKFEITEENFRMRKSRLLHAARANRADREK